MFFRKIKSITTKELFDRKNQQLNIIDVREQDEYEKGHIPGAMNIPLSTLGVSPFTPSETVYVICHSGMRSKRAVKYLMKQGFSAIQVKDGMMAWQGSLQRGRA